jgi:phosphoglycerate dehydrogenase-like enzyme
LNRSILITNSAMSHGTTQLRRLSNAGFQLIERYDLGPDASEEFLAHCLRGVWGVIAGGERYSRDVLEGADALKVIARPGTGYDTIDLSAATQAGIVVFTTPGVNADAVADFAIGLMLAVLRGIPALDKEVRDGRWGAGPPARDLHGAVVGIVGLGAIGRTVARRLDGFDCIRVGSDPVVDGRTAKEAGVELLPLSHTLEQAEVLTLHMPLTEATCGLIGASELQAMRSDAVLINTSRGSVVQQEALVDALETGSIAGAGLDVFEREPVELNDPLLALPNVLLSSHVASHTFRGIDAMLGGVVDGLLEIMSGGVPSTALNPEIVGTDTGR